MGRLILALPICLALCLFGAGLRAQDGALSLAEDMLDLLAETPGRFRDQAMELIRGFGDGDGITAQGLALSVASERAAARASAMRQFLALDLDGDLALTAAEAAQATSVMSARARGRLLARMDAADLDGDGRLDLPELSALGTEAALRAVSPEEEAERKLNRPVFTGGQDLTCHGIFPPSSTRVCPNLRTDNEAHTINGRTDHRHSDRA